MPAPSSSLATTRPELAGSFMEFDMEMDRLGFIGHRVFPMIDVIKSSGIFGKIPIEQLLKVRNTLRAPGAGYSRSEFTFQNDSFTTDEHGTEEAVDDNSRTMYRDFFDAQVIARSRAIDAIMRNAEIRIATAVFNATTWTGSALTTAPTNEWDDATNGVPLTDVEAARRKVWDGTGIWPNALIINRKVFQNIKNTDQVVNRIKYQNFQDARAGNMNATALAQLFDLDMVIVAGSAKDSAKEGQATTIAPVWSDEYAMVCKIATSSDIQEPCIGRTFHWAEDGSQVLGTIEDYREEQSRSDIIRVRHQVDEKVLYAQAGHLISNVTA